MTQLDDIGRYRENLQDETDGAATYRALASLESDPHLAELYVRLAETEERHGKLWADKLNEAGAPPGDLKPTRRARILIWLAGRLGPGMLVSTIAAQERAGQFMYDDQPEAVGTSLPEITASAAEWLADEGYDPTFGACPLKRLLQTGIADPLAMGILEGEFREGDTVIADATPEGIALRRP